MRTPLKYVGGKSRMIDTILPLFPEHSTYVEPFFGSGAIYFAKPKSEVEVINDRDNRVVNFYRVMRDKAQREELVEQLKLTPYSREEHKYAKLNSENAELSELERARLFCILICQGFVSNIDACWGYTVEHNGQAKAWAALPKRIITSAARLGKTQLECDNALAVIKRYDSKNTLVYADPPYLPDAITGRKSYKYELTPQEHEELLDLLISCQSKVILSGYNSELYNNKLVDWNKIEVEMAVKCNSGKYGAKKKATEVLYIKPNSIVEECDCF